MSYLPAFFVALSAVVVFLVFTILVIVKRQVSEIPSLLDRLLLISSKSGFIVYICIFILLAILDYMIIAQNEYYYSLAVTATYISYLFGLTFCGLTIINFLKWYRQDREFRILGYLITTSVLFALILFSVSYFSVNPNDLNLKIKSGGIGYAITMRGIASNIFQTWFSQATYCVLFRYPQSVFLSCVITLR